MPITNFKKKKNHQTRMSLRKKEYDITQLLKMRNDLKIQIFY